MHPQNRHHQARRISGLKIHRAFWGLLVLISLAACTVPFDPAGTTTAPAVQTASPQGLIRLFFTEPKYPDTGAEDQNGIDQNLVASIEKASQSIDMAAYEINLDSLVGALIRAHQRGVVVRVVVDTDNENEIPVDQMKQAGIKVVSDHQESLMHDKFTVIDHQEVWTGSWNYTHNCTFRNNNNALAIVSEKLAENYTTEFEEMFVENQFGAGSPSNTPHNWVKVGDIQVENYFAPEEDVQAIILREIKAARNSIQFMTYVLTDNQIGEALADKKKEGTVVQGVVEDRFAESNGSEVSYLLKNGVDVLRDGNHYLMHHKVIILDGQTVITGSYNFTRNAQEQNDENVLVIHNKEIAAQYLEEFQKVYGQAEK